MTWYSKELGDGHAAYGPTGHIDAAFRSLALSGRAPLDWAVFSRYDLDANVVTAYFSPRASALAQAMGATPCPKPRRDKGFGLMSGDQRCWNILFPSE